MISNLSLEYLNLSTSHFSNVIQTIYYINLIGLLFKLFHISPDLNKTIKKCCNKFLSIYSWIRN